MQEIKGNLFDLLQNYTMVCITTNGAVKKNGECVMGRGCAFTAKSLWPSIPKRLGDLILKNGNITQKLGWVGDCDIVAFPVKHHWAQKADLELIKKSAEQLVAITDVYDKVLIPRPGCGNGQLKWEEVKPILEEILDDRFTIIDFK